jgi:CHAD domain-containing protein
MRAPFSPGARLAALRHHLRMSTADDDKAVHDLRSTIERLRAWLMLGGWHMLDDDLRALRRSAGETRDLTLHLERAPPPEVATRLLPRVIAARKRLREALGAREHLEALTLALAVLPPVPVDEARTRLARLARCTRRHARRALDRRADPTTLHELRRSARRLRFALEWLGRCPRRLRRLVRALGEVGDRLAALRDVPRGTAPDYRRRLRAELDHWARRSRRRLRRTLPLFEELGR